MEEEIPTEVLKSFHVMDMLLNLGSNFQVCDHGQVI